LAELKTHFALCLLANHIVNETQQTERE